VGLVRLEVQELKVPQDKLEYLDHRVIMEPLELLVHKDSKETQVCLVNQVNREIQAYKVLRDQLEARGNLDQLVSRANLVRRDLTDLLVQLVTLGVLELKVQQEITALRGHKDPLDPLGRKVLLVILE